MALTVKAPTGRAEGFRWSRKDTYKDTYADPVTGYRLFVVHGNFEFKITKAKPLGGNLYEVTAK